MSLVFEPGGRLNFVVGFEHWNPGRWAYDSGAAELRLTLPKLKSDEIPSFLEAVMEGYIERFEPRAKTVVYRYTDSTRVLIFQGIPYSPDTLPK